MPSGKIPLAVVTPHQANLDSSGSLLVKVDAGLARNLKLLLQELVAARRQYPKRFLKQKARLGRRPRGENWLAALDQAAGRSVQRKRASADLLAKLTNLPEVADRFAAWLRDDDLAWRAEVIAFVGVAGLHQFAPCSTTPWPAETNSAGLIP